MSGNNRQITRRPPQTAPGAPPGTGVGTSPAKIEALRKLVASGQYQVSPRWIATRIFRAAGVKLPE
jgi:anti-sigma28 factor (negative regulator of flagellin synthesis)